MKSFGKPRWGGGFDATQPQQAVEKILGEPLFASLRAEVAHQVFHLLATNRLTQRDEEVRRAQVCIVFRDFIFQDQVVPKSVPGQIAHHAVVLVQIVSEVSKDNIRCKIFLEFLEAFFHGRADIREEPIPKRLHDDCLPAHAPQEGVRATLRFLRALGIGTEHQPVKLNSVRVVDQAKDRPPAADLNIVAVRAEA